MLRLQDDFEIEQLKRNRDLFLYVQDQETGQYTRVHTFSPERKEFRTKQWFLFWSWDMVSVIALTPPDELRRQAYKAATNEFKQLHVQIRTQQIVRDGYTNALYHSDEGKEDVIWETGRGWLK